jgi:hypothetical protein
MNYAKLVGAITALTAAINGYLDLEKKNALVYQALASKVNHMAEELSELKGQNQVMMIFLARKEGMTDMLEAMEAEPERAPASSPRPVRDDPEEAAEEVSEEAAEAFLSGESGEEVAFVGTTEVSVESEEEPEPKAEKRVVVQAYQELPANLDDLVQVQEQLQVQEE